MFYKPSACCICQLFGIILQLVHLCVWIAFSIQFFFKIAGAYFSKNLICKACATSVNYSCLTLMNTFKMSIHLVCFRFIYTDEVHLNVSNVMSVLYASKKYIVTKLTKRCTNYLERNISPATAAGILQHSMMFDEKDLKDKVLARIRDEAPAVLSSDDFMTLSKEALHEVLQLNLKISKEMEVFEACMKWAENKCQEFGKRTDRENLREALGDENLFLIRFPTMTLDDMQAVRRRHVLKGTEYYRIILYLKADRDNREHLMKYLQYLPYPIVPRFDQTPRSLLAQSFWRHSHTMPCNETYVIRTLLDCTVSRPMKLKKVFIHACPKEDTCFSQTVSVTLVQNGKALFNYAGEHETTPCLIRRPYTLNSTINSSQFAMNVQDILVQAGELQMNIEAKTKNIYPHFSLVLDMPLSRSAQSASKRKRRGTKIPSEPLTKLSDQFVSIDFKPVAHNLLLGIEYAPM